MSKADENLKLVSKVIDKNCQVYRLPGEIEKEVLKPHHSKFLKNLARDSLQAVKENLDYLNPHTKTVEQIAGDANRKYMVSLVESTLSYFNHENTYPNHEWPTHPANHKVRSDPDWAPATKIDDQFFISKLFAAARDDILACRDRLRKTVRAWLKTATATLIKRGWLYHKRFMNTRNVGTFSNLASQEDDSITYPITGFNDRDGYIFIREHKGRTELVAFTNTSDRLTKTLELSENPANQNRIRKLFKVTRYVLFNGVWVYTRDYFKTDWNLREFFNIQHAEQRRVLMERYGFDRLIQQHKTKTLDVDMTSVHAEDPEAPSITRALIELEDDDSSRFIHVVVGTDGSSGRCYYMLASRPGPIWTSSRAWEHCTTLAEWDRFVGQPEHLFAQA